MNTSIRITSSHFLVFTAVMAFAVSVGTSSAANAAVIVTNDWTTLLNLEKPTGKPDEPGLSGFEYLLSGRTGEYRANDQYLVAGEESMPSTTLVQDLGGVTELSGTSLDFSIRHNLVGGRNFTFSLDGPLAGAPSVLCWGLNCAAGSISAETINGLAPITRYNGLQIQVRAQEVALSSVSILNLNLTGVDIAPGSDPFFAGTVTPATPSTIPLDPPGRIGQWLIGDSLDLLLNEWELSGTVTLTRNPAIDDLTKVRLAVDLVNDTTQPIVPLPASVWLFGSALLGLMGLRRRS